MQITATIVVSSIIFVESQTLAIAENLHTSKDLHDSECLICHDSEVYSRKGRRIDSLNQLKLQVRTCQQDTGAEWTETQIEAVTQYLNKTFYYFKL